MVSGPPTNFIGRSSRAARRNTLTVTGWLDLADLHPTGGADGDTLPLTLVEARWTVGRRESVLRDFGKWIAVGRVRSRVVDARGRVRVRLLGVDTPELHYRPSIEAKTAAALRKKGVVVPYFRQPGAVRSAARLRERLATIGPRVMVRATRLLARPEDAIDTYGRLVAWVGLPDRSTLNAWLLETGLGAPAFYSGFQQADVEALVKAAQVGRRKLAARWTTPSGAFPWSVVAGEAPLPSEDVGRFVHPKLFRRWAGWAAQRRAGTTRLGFAAWLDAAEERFALGDQAMPVAGFQESMAGLLEAGPRVFAEVVFPAARARVVVGRG